MSDKPTLAMYWAASCGGCEVSVLGLGDKILKVDEIFDIVFFPCIADFKYEDVRNYPDRYIDLCLFNGAIRSSENEEMAHLLRRKSKLLVAYGSCACEGCIPALSNLTSKAAAFDAIYLNNPSTPNPDGIIPRTRTRTPDGTIELPNFFNTVKSLDQVIAVDYYLPGCPPEAPRIWEVLEALVAGLLQGAELPPKGSVVGARDVAVCEECALAKGEKRIRSFFRPYEILPESGACLLEQGLICAGPATRAGCGALCPQVGMGCRGCYGPLQGVEDQGARMLTAIGSIIDVGKTGDHEADVEEQLDTIMDGIVDPAGTFYRFSMAHSILHRARINGHNAR